MGAFEETVKTLICQNLNRLKFAPACHEKN
jgi:hypothetical protein